jgi:hypothetical protein
VPSPKRMTRWLGLAAAVAVAGCGETPAPPPEPPPPPAPVAAALYPPWTLSQTPAAITLRWYPDVTPSASANLAAKQHCASWHKTAELVSDTRDGSAEIAQYRCR